jgi:hypothetical protein
VTDDLTGSLTRMGDVVVRKKFLMMAKSLIWILMRELNVSLRWA